MDEMTDYEIQQKELDERTQKNRDEFNSYQALLDRVYALVVMASDADGSEIYRKVCQIIGCHTAAVKLTCEQILEEAESSIIAKPTLDEIAARNNIKKRN